MIQITEKTLKDKFMEYNDLYFGGKLPLPVLTTHRSFFVYGQFRCNLHAPGSRVRNAKISMSCYYDYDDDEFRDILVHEMLHYRLNMSRKYDGKVHGPMFLAEADSLNMKFGLNITVKPELVKSRLNKNAPRFSPARLFVRW